MLHYVFMVGDYAPIPSANGNCVRALVDELISRGNIVDVICFGDAYCYGYKERPIGSVHTIERDRLPDENVGKLAHKIACIPRALWWPVGNPRLKEHYIRMLQKVNENLKIDCVIACQLPVASSAAGMEFKKKVPNVSFFIYELDSFWNSYYLVEGWKRLFIKKCKKIERQFYDVADGILHLECNRENYKGGLYEKYNGKSYYLDIPLINKTQYYNYTEMIHNLGSGTEKIKLIYTGSLSSTFRKPNYIVELIKKVSTSLPCELTFYSRGCDADLKREAEKSECIKSLGYVEKDVLEKGIANSDFLVSIGNSLPEGHNAIPSKIFDYMSTGKPVVHILAGNNDICKKYFNEYPKVLLLDPRGSFERNFEILRQFLIENKGVRVPFDVVSKAFYKNTPQYSVDVIEAALNAKDIIKQFEVNIE